ncbi:hypothetical protein EV426DRAFT_538932 [Tirmania nivea]|nr:hypothetical protein EV426DRAFT_538932 [Tirmania nivea]
MLAGAESAPNTNSFGADQASNTLSSPRTGRHYADICKTALYKTVLLIDDSKSMRDGERYKILTRALERVAELNATIDEDGLSMRFLNYPRRKEHQIPWGLDSIKGVLRMRAILKTNLWKGGTELGGMLLEKVLEPLVFEKARQNQLNKPILISIITDGEPDSENHGRSLQEVIRDCKRRLREQYPHYGENAVAFHITQIGDSPAASNFLDDLAQDPVVGNLIYCTSGRC